MSALWVQGISVIKDPVMGIEVSKSRPELKPSCGQDLGKHRKGRLHLGRFDSRNGGCRDSSGLSQLTLSEPALDSSAPHEGSRPAVNVPRRRGTHKFFKPLLHESMLADPLAREVNQGFE